MYLYRNAYKHSIVYPLAWKGATELFKSLPNVCSSVLLLSVLFLPQRGWGVGWPSQGIPVGISPMQTNPVELSLLPGEHSQWKEPRLFLQAPLTHGLLSHSFTSTIQKEKIPLELPCVSGKYYSSKPLYARMSGKLGFYNFNMVLQGLKWVGNEDTCSIAWLHIYMTGDSIGSLGTVYLEKGSVCAPSMTVTTYSWLILFALLMGCNSGEIHWHNKGWL